ncbi:hypothetical protein BTHI11S_03411 [Bosea thiooxidans]|uniref:DUF2950 domain-containing protein n=1 Tax=Bosea thiooxidans TaxID=53254 RepID=A0A1T5FNM0_9HYPH|nr:DUF2950 domain-containing protein [Bosea thiooxidans]SKB97741.1 Protein of unknown function [Bosea thiooxidans]
MTMTWPTVHLLIRLLCGVAAGMCAASTVARAQEIFGSPQAAAAALLAAVRENQSTRLYSIFGMAGRDILFSGDEKRDEENRQRFVAAYEARHSIVETGRTATLLLGEEAFPFPIPIFHSRGGWKFMVEAGRRELLARRIGRNELDAIQTSLAILDAQFEYAAKGHNGRSSGIYAQRIVSQPDKHDGLYWPTAPGEEPSPLGEFAARAAGQGYVPGQTRQPYHGYYFKILRKQGAAASGGALDYVAGGNMIGGFGVLAYPATYARSGITSFLVNHAGTVYQKDLGPNTRLIASRMNSFDPGSGWEKVNPKTSP